MVCQKKYSNRQKEKHFPCRPIMPGFFQFSFSAQTDACLPTGQQGESECGLGCE